MPSKPSAASPTTSKPGTRDSSAVMPRRNSVWSSMTTMRIAPRARSCERPASCDHLCCRGRVGAGGRAGASGSARANGTWSDDLGAVAGARAHRDGAADARRALAHDAQAHVRGRVVRAARRIEAAAVVAHRERVVGAARRARPRRAWPCACLRTFDTASCRMCITCSWSSGASGTAAPLARNSVCIPVWCSSRASSVRMPCSTSPSATRVRKCTSSSRTSA